MDAPLLGDEEPVAVEEDQRVCPPLPRLLVFRFVCAYLVLFAVGAFTNSIWNPLNIWLGVHLFHLSTQSLTVVRTGSGDTALAFVQEFWVVVLAALISVAWQVVDRKRANYRRADAWLRIFVRYVLGFVVLQYGFGKLFPVQFGTLTPSRLFETYGESSPMGLLWTFMAASGPYTMFAGLMEVIPGVLLLYRRTAAVGALISATVMLNVVMLNLCYDVPVKLYSLNLLFMALFLAAPYLYSMASLLVLHRVTMPPSLYTTFSYSQPDVNHLVLQGSWMNRQVVIRLTKVDISKLVLVNRGFHWISQYPYNP